MNKKFVLYLIVVVILVGAGFLYFRTPALAPNMGVGIQQNVENYLKENIVALSPVQAVLGGTWYVVSSTIDLEKNSGTVTYEDGHIQEIKNFSYTTNGKGDVMNLIIVGSDNPVACTQEAKLCSDGSAVGRTGPNCEFALCPDTQIKEETTAGLNQRIFNNGVYITPLSVVSDSRCPAKVMCVWAGEITIKIKLEKGEVNKEVNLGETQNTVFEGYQVFFESASSGKTDYKFLFKVVPITANTTKGKVEGRVTLSPTCPVERMPPDPGCSPKPYATSIDILKTGSSSIVTSIQSDTNGVFSATLDTGSYTLRISNGQRLPICANTSVEIKSGQTTTADISCDTGIR